MELNTLDILLAIPLIWGAYKGFKRGIIIELASLIALILGIYGALNFSEYSAGIINSNFHVDPHWIGIVSFTLTFLVIVISIYIAAKIIDKTLKFAALGILIKISGMVFGFLKFALILAVLLFIIEEFDSEFNFLGPNWQKGSILYETLDIISSPIQKFVGNIDFESLEDEFN